MSERAQPTPNAVQQEITRIQRLFEESSGDKEDLLSYARDVAALRASAPEAATQLANEQLWGRFVNHYWDSFEGEKQIVLKHIRAVLDYHIENFCPAPSTATTDELSPTAAVEVYLNNLPIKQMLIGGEMVDVVEPQYLLASDRSAILAALAAYTPSAAMTDWQDISTAPKDGTRVLIAQDDLWMAVARYWPCNSYWIEDAASGLKLNPPTHWSPVPTPPVSRNDRWTPSPKPRDEWDESFDAMTDAINEGRP